MGMGRGGNSDGIINASPLKVAVIDDDHAVRDGLQFLLRVAGHTVETFASAADFLKAEIDHFACLILDHHMPQMTGLELVESLRRGGITVPVLLMTGALSPSSIVRASQLGVDQVLEKPVSQEDLLDFIDLQMT